MNALGDLKKNKEKLRKYQKELILIIAEGEAKGQEFQEAIHLAWKELNKVEGILAAMGVRGN